VPAGCGLAVQLVLVDRAVPVVLHLAVEDLVVEVLAVEVCALALPLAVPEAVLEVELPPGVPTVDAVPALPVQGSPSR